MGTSIFSLAQIAAQFFGRGASTQEVQPDVDYDEVLKAVAHGVAHDTGRTLCDKTAHHIVHGPDLHFCSGFSPYVAASFAPEYLAFAEAAVKKLVHEHFGLVFEPASQLVYAAPKNNSY